MMTPRTETSQLTSPDDSRQPHRPADGRNLMREQQLWIAAVNLLHGSSGGCPVVRPLIRPQVPGRRPRQLERAMLTPNAEPCAAVSNPREIALRARSARLPILKNSMASLSANAPAGYSPRPNDSCAPGDGQRGASRRRRQALIPNPRRLPDRAIPARSGPRGRSG